MASIEEVLLRVKVDWDTQKISVGNAELKKLGDAAGDTDKKTAGLTGSFIKANVIMGAVKTVASGLFSVFKDGFQEIAETETAMNRAASAAARAGVDFDALTKAAEGIENPLIGAAEKLSIVSDLVSRGFDPSQAQELARTMGDLAASGKSAGETVKDAMLRMADALVAGRVAGADLQRILPSLKSVGADALQAFAQGSATAAQKQQIFNAIMADGANAAGKLDEYLKKPQGTIERLSEAFDDFKENLTSGFIQGIAPIGEALTGLMDGMDGFGESAREIGQLIGQVLSAAFTAFKDILSSLVTNGVTPLSAAWQALGGESTSLSEKIMIVAQTIGGTLISAFKLASAGALIFGNAGTILENIWLGVKQSILESINSVLEGLIGVTGKVADFAPGAADAYAALRDAQTALQPTITATNKAYDESSITISNLSDNVKGLVAGAFDPLDLSFKKTEQSATNLNNKGLKPLSEEARKLLEAFQKQQAPLAALEQQFAELAATGVGVNEWVQVYREEIIKAAEAQMQNGIALTETQQKMVDLAAGYRELAAEEQRLDAIRKVEFASNQKIIEQNNLLAAAQDKILETIRTSGTSYIAIVAALDKYGDGVDAINPDLQEFYDKLILTRDGLLAKEDATNETAAALKQLAEEEKRAAAAAAQFAAVLGFVGQALSGLGDAIGGGLGAALGSAEQAFGSFWNTGKAIMEQTGSMTASWAGAIGAGAAEIGNAIGGEMGSAIATIGKFTATGAMFGPWGAAIGAGIGVAIVAIKSLRKDWNETTSNIIENVMGIIGVSAELGKKIAEMAKEIGDAATAATLSLVAMMDDVGVNADNFDEFAQATRDVFSFLERGQIDAAQATEILGGAFQRLLAVGTDAIGMVSPKLLELIELSRQFGLEIPAITQFIQQQVSTLGSSMGTLITDLQSRLNDYLASLPEGLGVLSSGQLESFKADATAFAGIILSAFNEAIEAGASVQEALAAISPNLGQLKELFKELGLSLGDVGLGFLAQMDNIGKKFPDQMARINAVTQALVAMNNLGIAPSADQFRALQNSAMAAFDQINKDGNVSKAELESIRPLLVLLANQALQYGLALSPATIELLKQAGLWDEVANKPKATGDATQTAMDRAATAMEKVATALEAIVTQFGAAATGADGLTDSINNIPTQVDVNVAVNVDDSEMDKLQFGGRIESRDSLVGVEVVRKAAQLFVLHQGEGIVGRNVMQQMSEGNPANNVGGGTTNITVNINGSNLSEAALKRLSVQAVMEAMQKSGPLRNLNR